MARVLVLFVIAMSTLLAEGPKPPDDILFDDDVVYGKAVDVDLTLDLARPKEARGARRCILIIHGGGWAAGQKEAHDDLAFEFARRGWVAASVGYRLAPKHRFPAQIEDVKCAVRFLRAHAEEYGIDPARLAAMGFSAGAHLSMMLGVMAKEDGLEGDGGCPDPSSRVQAVVSFFGPVDCLAKDLPEQSQAILKNWIGGTASEMEEAYRKASPVTYVTPDDAPMLLMQGTKDALVPHTQAYVMADALTKAGVPGRVELLVGHGHGWPDPAEIKRTLEAAYAFLDERLPSREPSRPVEGSSADAPWDWVRTRIARLGSDSFEERDAASEELAHLAREWREAVTQATQSKDAEVRVRAEELNEALSSGRSSAPSDMTLDVIVDWLEKGVKEYWIMRRIKKKGATYSLTRSDEDRLRSAGASGDLIDLMTRPQPKR